MRKEENNEKKQDPIGMSTMAYLFLQIFLRGAEYEPSVMEEMNWMVREMASKEPDPYLLAELKWGLSRGYYVTSEHDTVFAFAMQRLVTRYAVPRKTAKKICVRLQKIFADSQKNKAAKEKNKLQEA